MIIQHLRLKDTSKFSKTPLIDLQKINVICGRNNSGKSTFLDALNRPYNEVDKSPDVGISFSEETVKVFERAFENRVYSHIAGHYLSVISDIANENESCWFANDRDQFFQLVNERASVPRQINVGDDENPVIIDNSIRTTSDDDVKIYQALNDGWNTFFNVDGIKHGNRIRPVLVSPKRSLELTKAINTAEPVDQTGVGLLNYLFFAQNQNEQSPDKKVYNKILTAFVEISSGYEFTIVANQQNSISLSFKSSDSDWIDASACGLGLRDLLVILYFSISGKHNLILLEEPENHIHPDIQKKLLRFLKEKTDKQYFIATHSNVFLNSTYVDRVFFTEFKDGLINLSDATSRAKILHSLGYSVTENLVSDLIILVEGSSDKEVLEEFLSKIGFDAKYDIKIWILGGDEMTKQDLSVFSQDRKVVALIDQDPQSEKTRLEFQKNCEENSIHCHKLERYSIESYFSVRALKENFNKYDIRIPEIEGVDDDQWTKMIQDEPLWNALGVDTERKKELKKKLKRKNREIAREMALEEIEGTDLKIFFDNVSTILQKL